jgi:putative spermidine/putrescine transport system ATP-binding protein
LEYFVTEAPTSVSDTSHSQQGILLRGITKHFGAHAAVSDVDLEVYRGEFFTMLGPSGSGKTTLLRLIAGFEVPDAGTISLRGVDVTGTPPYQRGVNTVFQDYALFPHFDVARNVAYGLRVRRVKRTEIDERVKAALEMVQMTEFATRRPAQLSGGQRQRVALARAIINEPQVLLLDEPLGALDLKLRQEMQVELKRIQRQIGITFIYVTHDQEEALTMSDRLAVFRNGQIEQIGPPSEVYERPATEFVASFVGTSNVIETPSGRAVLRPEKIEIASQFSDGRPSTTGRVVDVAYLGMVTRFSILLDDGNTMTVARQNSSGDSEKNALAPDSRVVLSWDLNDAFPLTSHSVAETQLGSLSKGAT